VLPTLAVVLLALTQANTSPELKGLLDEVSGAYANLEAQTIRPAEGYIKYDYLIPGGYYRQMWDWDGFFIGCHLAHQGRDRAKYLKGWVLSFAGAMDGDGHIPGMITTKGPVPVNAQFGHFAMKPFLAQGAVIAAERLGDYQWVAPVWEELRRAITYRENTQYDRKWELFFWENAMQSGAVNNAALTNDPKDRNAILAADLCTFQLREYKAMGRLAEMLGRKSEAEEYQQKAAHLRAAMLKHLWFAQDVIFFNIRRDNGNPVRHISYSSFVPLIEDVLSPADARNMIRRYLWNPDHMLASYGLAVYRSRILATITRARSIFTRTGRDRYGSTQIISIISPLIATGLTTKPASWPPFWAASCLLTFTNMAQCTSATMRTLARDSLQLLSSRRTMSSPDLSAGICWCRICCSAKVRRIVFCSTGLERTEVRLPRFHGVTPLILRRVFRISRAHTRWCSQRLKPRRGITSAPGARPILW